VENINTQAAKDFYKEVKAFCERIKPWQTALHYDITIDEKWDITLISRRVYGNPHEVLAIMAAAGLDMLDQELKQKRIALPTASQLYKIKRRTGYESNSDYLENGQPTWL